MKNKKYSLMQEEILSTIAKFYPYPSSTVFFLYDLLKSYDSVLSMLDYSATMGELPINVVLHVFEGNGINWEERLKNES